ncbi:uncharacterized protein LOC119663663, partial [Teleopsis dalmanni]|uniref:uncharacterized protein LOC119663663 n=1 Tax=Teleopsis dalmanni TaxID=139649 RepID=UPI0018CF67B7
IEKGDTLPQQVCVTCAKNAISACLFKKKCEDADNFFRQQLLIQKIEATSAGGREASNYVQVERDVGSVVETTSTHRNLNLAIQSKETNTEKEESDQEEGDKMPLCHAEIHNGINNGKIPFDFNSIRLMHEYMQHQLSKITEAHGASNSAESGSEAEADDDEPLPLIPEIELITPSDDMNANVNGNDMGNNTTPMRGYQCPSCFQIFEMKQILKAHMQSVHGTPGPVYECTNCRKTYFYKRFLEKHVRRGRCVKKRRNQTRPMQCSDCHVLFPTGHHLGWHKRTGCPSKAAKMPLQQLFKQNIVQYNNFPKRIGIRKPENAIYIHNRKVIMAGNKRKGRTRIKLDAKKIALAKQLILREATTTVIANELNISRTFAWRLRKSLVNGVSLHERVIDPNVEDATEILQINNEQKMQIPEFHQTEIDIKTENNESDNEESEEHEDHEDREEHEDREDREVDDDDEEDIAESVSNQSFNQRNEKYHQQNKEYIKDKGKDDPDESEDNSEIESDEEEIKIKDKVNNSHLQLEQQQQKQHRIIQNMPANLKIENMSENQKEISHGIEENVVISPLAAANQFPSTVTAVIHQLPVNLSIRPISTMQNNEIVTEKCNFSKKPRKPNVFVDDEKYAMAKTLVAQNASTMEIARALNVSQMTAWKVRDAIVKGVPLSYRNKKEIREVAQHETIEESTDKGAQRHFDKNQQQQQQIEQQQHLLLQHEEQIKQQQLHLLHQKLEQQKHQQLQQLQKQQQLQQQLQQQNHLPQKIHLPEQQQSLTNAASKVVHPRRRLKAAEREVRDKEITREILDLIKEDSNIQYWKVSARLAEKGFAISPSSVCQKLKSMGIHRRWKPGDKPPTLDIEQLKSANTNSSSADEGYEAQLDLSGANFLNAFTR